MTHSSSTIAVFDFDHTLIKSDSFWSFLGKAVGWPQTLWALLQSLCVYAREGRQQSVHARTFIKDQLLHRLLAKRRLESLIPAAQKLRISLRWNEPILKKLLEHHESGHHIVIASGGLDLYLPLLLKDVPHQALLCTEVGVNQGIVTGEMILGNCVREQKAQRVADYLNRHGPFSESWGYGNIPHDLPMLQLLKHRLVV